MVVEEDRAIRRQVVREIAAEVPGLYMRPERPVPRTKRTEPAGSRISFTRWPNP
jgi:hypothetical protein